MPAGGAREVVGREREFGDASDLLRQAEVEHHPRAERLPVVGGRKGSADHLGVLRALLESFLPDRVVALFVVESDGHDLHELSVFGEAEEVVAAAVLPDVLLAFVPDDLHGRREDQLQLRDVGDEAEIGVHAVLQRAASGRHEADIVVGLVDFRIVLLFVGPPDVEPRSVDD